MIKRLLFNIVLPVLFTGIAIAQTDTTKGWTQKYRDEFRKSCVNSAKAIGEDSARRYCACMMAKLEVMLPDQRNADKLTAADMEKPEMKQMIKDCLNMKWQEKDRNTFRASCEKSAATLGAEKAKKYCNCMLEKLEAKFATAEEADKITADDLAKPEWKKVINGCLQ
jgi:hypothetical protein